MSAEQMKKAVAQAALKYVSDDTIIGVGTGSTANAFIDALADAQVPLRGAVASSEATADRLKAAGYLLEDLNLSLIHI